MTSVILFGINVHPQRHTHRISSHHAAMITYASCLQIEIVSQLSCLVAMTAELCYGTVSMDTVSLPLDNLPLRASVFASQLSHRVKGEII